MLLLLNIPPIYGGIQKVMPRIYGLDFSIRIYQMQVESQIKTLKFLRYLNICSNIKFFQEIPNKYKYWSRIQPSQG